jgi:hypothetical protein
MTPERRQYALSKDQPILEQARRRKKGTKLDREALEVEFWAKFPLDKFARGWQPEVAKLRPQAA